MIFLSLSSLYNLMKNKRDSKKILELEKKIN